MNRNQACNYIKHFSVMKAFAEGKDVEYRVRDSGAWHLTEHPEFLNDIEYRIKPIPKEVWLLLNNKDKIMTILSATTKEHAEAAVAAYNVASTYMLGAPHRAILMREVEDDK